MVVEGQRATEHKKEAKEYMNEMIQGGDIFLKKTNQADKYLAFAKKFNARPKDLAYHIHEDMVHKLQRISSSLMRKRTEITFLGGTEYQNIKVQISNKRSDLGPHNVNGAKSQKQVVTGIEQEWS